RPNRSPMFSLRPSTYAVALALLTCAGPRRWTVIVDSSGRCFCAVPPNWRTDDLSLQSMASSPDGRAIAALYWLPKSVETFAADLKSNASGTVVHQSSAGRFSAEYRGVWPGSHHVIATASIDGACVLSVDVANEASAEVRQAVKDVMETAESVR